MTMTLPAYRTMTLAEWDALGETEERCELVRGVLIMAPSELYGNRRVATHLALALTSSPGAALVTVVTEMDLLVDADPQRPTVRRVDIAAVAVGVDDETPRLDPAQVLLVVEIVSESSQERDWVIKRDEYAAAGIPAYLVVDRHRGQVALFSAPVAGRYAGCAVGAALDVPLAGAVVRIDLADLTRPA